MPMSRCDLTASCSCATSSRSASTGPTGSPEGRGVPDMQSPSNDDSPRTQGGAPVERHHPTGGTGHLRRCRRPHRFWARVETTPANGSPTLLLWEVVPRAARPRRSVSRPTTSTSRAPAQEARDWLDQAYGTSLRLSGRVGTVQHSRRRPRHRSPSTTCCIDSAFAVDSDAMPALVVVDLINGDSAYSRDARHEPQPRRRLRAGRRAGTCRSPTSATGFEVRTTTITRRRRSRRRSRTSFPAIPGELIDFELLRPALAGRGRAVARHGRPAQRASSRPCRPTTRRTRPRRPRTAGRLLAHTLLATFPNDVMAEAVAARAGGGPARVLAVARRRTRCASSRRAPTTRSPSTSSPASAACRRAPCSTPSASTSAARRWTTCDGCAWTWHEASLRNGSQDLGQRRGGPVRLPQPRSLRLRLPPGVRREPSTDLEQAHPLRGVVRFAAVAHLARRWQGRSRRARWRRR